MLLEERTAQLRLAIEVISDKWRIAILHQLSDGPRRTAQLQRALGEIAPKVLTQTLRGLERDGLVERKAYAVLPPRVDYRLTDLALPLLRALDELCRWSETHGRRMAMARSSYDAQADARANLDGRGTPARAGSDRRQIGSFLQARFGVRETGTPASIGRPLPVKLSDARMRQVTSA